MLVQRFCQHYCVSNPTAVQGPTAEGMVSPDASFIPAEPFVPGSVIAGGSVPGNDLASQSGSAHSLAPALQPQPESQFRAETRSHSHEAEASSLQQAPATESASSAATRAAGVSHGDDVEGADGAGQQDLGWGNGAGRSELNALGMTGRSVSSKSGTIRRKVSASTQSHFLLMCPQCDNRLAGRAHVTAECHDSCPIALLPCMFAGVMLLHNIQANSLLTCHLHWDACIRSDAPTPVSSMHRLRSSLAKRRPKVHHQNTASQLARRISQTYITAQ